MGSRAWPSGGREVLLFRLQHSGGDLYGVVVTIKRGAPLGVTQPGALKLFADPELNEGLGVRAGAPLTPPPHQRRRG